VLVLSVSRTGGKRPKDSGGAYHHYETCEEIMSKETSKQILLYSMSKWWLLKCLAKVWKGEEGNWKVVSPFSFFESLLFIYFLILSNAKMSKNKYAVEKEKRKWWIWGWERKFKCKWWKRKWDNYGFTFQRELHIYSLRARLSPLLWRLIRWCDWRSQVFPPMSFLVDFF
jgi:hypothetical protein